MELIVVCHPGRLPGRYRPPLPPLLLLLVTGSLLAGPPLATASSGLAQQTASAVLQLLADPPATASSGLAQQTASAVLQLLRPARQPLLVFSCGAGPVPLVALLAELRWPAGLLLADCGRPPCAAGRAARLLYSDQPGPRLLLLQEAGCLNGTGAAPASRWSRGQALHLSTDCGRSLGHPLFARVGRPVCLEPRGDRLMVAQRTTNDVIRRSGLRASRSWLLSEDDLTNMTLNVVYENYSPFFGCAEQTDGLCSRPAAMASAVLLDAMSHHLGFRLRYYRSPDGSWGQLVNGTWIGMVGEVAAGRAELAVGGIFITPLRATATDFCRPLTLTYLEIVSRPVPHPVRGGFHSLLTPSVWALSVASLLAVTAALLAPRLLGGVAAGRLLPLLGRQLEVCLRLLVAQEARAARSAGPLLLAVWLLAGIVYRTAYTSNMISVLSAPPGSWAPESFSDLLQHGYRVVSHSGFGSYVPWIRAQNGSVARALLRRWSQQEHTEAFAHIVSSEERVALLGETPSVVNLIYDAMLASDGAVTERLVHRGREKHMPSFVAWAAQKHAPFVRRLDEVLRWVQPTGLVERLLEDGVAARREEAHRRVRRRCRRLPRTCRRATPVVLGLPHLKAGFLLLGYGLLAACCCFLLELLLAACGRCRRQLTAGRETRAEGGPRDAPD